MFKKCFKQLMNDVTAPEYERPEFWTVVLGLTFTLLLIGFLTSISILGLSFIPGTRFGMMSLMGQIATFFSPYIISLTFIANMSIIWYIYLLLKHVTNRQ